MRKKGNNKNIRIGIFLRNNDSYNKIYNQSIKFPTKLFINALTENIN